MHDERSMAAALCTGTSAVNLKFTSATPGSERQIVSVPEVAALYRSPTRVQSTVFHHAFK